MDKGKIFTIILLPLMWLIYFIFEIISGNVTNKSEYIFNFIFILLLLLTGYIIYKLYLKYKKGFSTKILYILFFSLLAIDQVTKYIIGKFFFEKQFEILPDLLSFNPIINTKGSWLNVRFGTSINFTTLIILNFIAVFFFIEFYRYYTYKDKKGFFSDICFLTILVGCICSLIDKIFYGGSLDFIGISSLFIADIKDIYINFGIFSFLLAAYFSGFLTSEDGTTLKEDIQGIKKFFIFILKDLKILKNQ